MDSEPAHSPALQFELRLALRLAAEGVVPRWEAELSGPDGSAGLHFESLPALIRYLVRLDTITPPSRGIR